MQRGIEQQCRKFYLQSAVGPQIALLAQCPVSYLAFAVLAPGLRGQTALAVVWLHVEEPWVAPGSQDEGVA